MITQIKTKTRLGYLCLLIIFTASIFSSCEKEDYGTSGAEKETNEEIAAEVEYINASQVPALQSFITKNVKSLNTKSAVDSELIETPFGYIKTQDILRVRNPEVTNYTLKIHPKNPVKNSLFDLVVAKDSITEEVSSYVLEYAMDDSFAQDFFTGKKEFNEFKGEIKKYVSDPFIGDLSLKNGELPCPCEKLDSDDGGFGGGGTSGPGNTDRPGNNGGTTGGGTNGDNGQTTNCRVQLIVQCDLNPGRKIPRWNVRKGVGCKVLGSFLLCTYKSSTKSGSCAADDDGSCLNSPGNFGVSDISLVEYLQIDSQYNAALYFNPNQNLINAAGSFIWSYRNETISFEIAKELTKGVLEGFASAPFTDLPSMAYYRNISINTLKSDYFENKITVFTDITKAEIAGDISKEQTDRLLNFLGENDTEEALEFGKSYLEALQTDDFTKFLEQPLFTTDPYDVWKNELNREEKNLILDFPYDAFAIFSNRSNAVEETRSRFEPSDGFRNGIADAFRHAFFNALNTQDVGAFKAKLFSDAHESDNPPNLILEEQMDIFNNTVGQKVEIEIPNSSQEKVANWVNSKLVEGKLRYLSPLGRVEPPNYGINSQTKLIPTNE